MHGLCLRRVLAHWLGVISLLTSVSAMAEPDVNAGQVSQVMQFDSSWLLFLLLIIYIALLIGGRYIWVIVPNRHHLETSMARVREQAEREPRNDKAIEFLDLADKRLHNDLSLGKFSSVTRWVAFTGRQLAAWRLIHNAECLLIRTCNEELLEEHAHVTANELAGIRSVERAAVLKGRIESLLKRLENANGEQDIAVEARDAQLAENAGAMEATKASNDEVKRILRRLEEVTVEGRSLVFQLQDTRFEELADHQNKALYLIFTAVLILVGIGVLSESIMPVLVIGAAGGLLARLRKVMYRKATGFDYGVSWVGVFLAPLVGALTAWGGTLLFHILHQWGLLTDKMAIPIDEPNANTLIVALAFGFSATLFERFMERIESTAMKPLGANGKETGSPPD